MGRETENGCETILGFATDHHGPLAQGHAGHGAQTGGGRRVLFLHPDGQSRNRPKTLPPIPHARYNDDGEGSVIVEAMRRK